MILKVKSLDTPDRANEFLDGSSRGVVDLTTVSIGRGVYRPGWRWSEHAGPIANRRSQHHVGYVVSGQMMVRGHDGTESLAGPGAAFEAADDHDAWVVGDEPCVALDVAVHAPPA